MGIEHVRGITRRCVIVLTLAAAMVLGAVPAAVRADADTARAEFRAAVALLKAEQWSAAETHLRRALENRQSTVIAYNLAVALSKQGKVAESVALLRVAVGDEKSKKRVLKLCEALLAELEPKVARLTVNVAGDETGVEVELDGAQVTLETVRGGFEVDPGEHRLAAYRNGEVIAETSATLGEAESAEVSLFLKEAPPPEPVVVVPPPEEVAQQATAKPIVAVETAETAETSGKPVYKNPWLWTGIGVAVVGAVVAGVLIASSGSGSAAAPTQGTVGPGSIEFGAD